MSTMSLTSSKPELVRNSVSKENYVKPNYARKGFLKYSYQRDEPFLSE